MGASIAILLVVSVVVLIGVPQPFGGVIALSIFLIGLLKILASTYDESDHRRYTGVRRPELNGKVEPQGQRYIAVRAPEMNGKVRTQSRYPPFSYKLGVAVGRLLGEDWEDNDY